MTKNRIPERIVYHHIKAVIKGNIVKTEEQSVSLVLIPKRSACKLEKEAVVQILYDLK